MQVDFATFAAIRLSAELITFVKDELLQLRCTSRCFCAFVAAKQTEISKPFQSISALRFWQVTPLVESMCAWIHGTGHACTGYSVRDACGGYSLYTLLRLRITCRKILMATHAPLEAAVNSLLIQLGECVEKWTQVIAAPKVKESMLYKPERQALESCRNQLKALKRIRDSGFLWQTYGKTKRLGRDRDLLIFHGGRPRGMTLAYWDKRMPETKKFGWFGGKLVL